MTFTFDELQALIIRRGIHAEFGEPGEGWGIEQSPYELAIFLTSMQELNVQSCLEIGTGYRGGLSRFLAADMGWRVTTVDWKDYGHSFKDVDYIVCSEGWQNFEYPAFTSQFDLVFIDADHSYDAVKFDYEYYSKYARKVVAFHDIAGLRGCEGVQQFWSELVADPHKDTHRTIAPEKMAGIGWIEL